MNSFRKNSLIIAAALCVTGVVMVFFHLNIAGQIVFCGGFFLAIAVSVTLKRSQGGSYRKFAIAQGLHYKNNEKLEYLPPLLEHADHYSSIEKINGNYRNKGIELAIINLYFGGAKRPFVYHMGSIVTGITDARFIVRSLNSPLIDELGKHIPDTEEKFGGQMLQLEGGWNRYFNVLTPPGLQQSALQVLTPDVMEAMIDFAVTTDFEAAGGRLYAYHKGAIRPGPDLDSWLDLLAKIAH